jgi:23S rRNA pseudouridine1911/1915/1917 synthase
MEYYFDVGLSEAGKRIDLYLSKKIGRSREYCKRLIGNKNVSLSYGKNSLKPSYVVKFGDSIYIKIPDEKPLEIKSQRLDIDIIFENDRYFVINKPAGLVVHPGAGNFDNTLANALVYKLGHNFPAEDIRPGIIHRLDKDTSGIMIIAKNLDAKYKLSLLFKNRNIKKIYHALCFGVPKGDFFIINAPIARHPKLRKIMSVAAGGKEAITEVRIKERFKSVFLAEIELKTGRTHQIRVHMKYLDYPVVGDRVYQIKDSVKYPIMRQALHAYSLEFVDPFTGEYKRFIAKYQQDFVNLLNYLATVIGK